MESEYITERVHNVFANRCAFCSKKTYKKKNTIHNNYQLYTYVKQDQMSTILGWFFGSKHFWFNRGKKMAEQRIWSNTLSDQSTYF